MNKPIHTGEHEARAKSKWDKMSQDEVMNVLSQKDNLIKKLRAEV